MGVWHCEDCHHVGFYFNDEQREAAIKEHAQLGHDKESEIENIHPFDLADLWNYPNDGGLIVDVYLTRDEQGDIFTFPKTGKRYWQDMNAPRKAVAEFHTTDKPPVTLPPHCGSVLRIVPKTLRSENLRLHGKASDHIWLMEDGEEPWVIGVRMDCRDSGTVYLTREQAKDLSEQLALFIKD